MLLELYLDVKMISLTLDLHSTMLHRSLIVVSMERQICAKDLVLCRCQMVTLENLSSKPGGCCSSLSCPKVKKPHFSVEKLSLQWEVFFFQWCQAHSKHSLIPFIDLLRLKQYLRPSFTEHQPLTAYSASLLESLLLKSHRRMTDFCLHSTNHALGQIDSQVLPISVNGTTIYQIAPGKNIIRVLVDYSHSITFHSKSLVSLQTLHLKCISNLIEAYSD